jgi:hypothetical protein
MASGRTSSGHRMKHASLHVNAIPALNDHADHVVIAAATSMPRRFALIGLTGFFMLLTSNLLVTSAPARESDEVRQEQEGFSSGVENPLMPKRNQVTFSGTGAANFTPRNLHGEEPGPPPPPTCQPKSTQVGFQVRCVSDPVTKSSSTCIGSISFYGFNETRNVSGEITASLDGSYAMKLRSADAEIDACQLGNVVPVSSSLGNVISMPGCGLNVDGCAGNLTGTGANHALTTSASVIVTPIE